MPGLCGFCAGARSLGCTETEPSADATTGETADLFVRQHAGVSGVKRPSHWIVFWAAVAILFSAGEHVHPRLGWLLESVLIVLGLFLLREAIENVFQLRKANRQTSEQRGKEQHESAIHGAPETNFAALRSGPALGCVCRCKACSVMSVDKLNYQPSILIPQRRI